MKYFGIFMPLNRFLFYLCPTSYPKSAFPPSATKLQVGIRNDANTPVFFCPERSRLLVHASTIAINKIPQS
jgi:hypothetical protein